MATGAIAEVFAVSNSKFGPKLRPCVACSWTPTGIQEHNRLVWRSQTTFLHYLSHENSLPLWNLPVISTRTASALYSTAMLCTCWPAPRPTAPGYAALNNQPRHHHKIVSFVFSYVFASSWISHNSIRLEVTKHGRWQLYRPLRRVQCLARWTHTLFASREAAQSGQ